MFILTAGTPLASSSPYSRWWWVLGVLLAALLVWYLVSTAGQSRQRLGPPEDSEEHRDSDR